MNDNNWWECWTSLSQNNPYLEYCTEAECLWKYPLQVALPLLSSAYPYLKSDTFAPSNRKLTLEKLSNYSSYLWPSLIWIAAQYVVIFPLISYTNTPTWDDRPMVYLQLPPWWSSSDALACICLHRTIGAMRCGMRVSPKTLEEVLALVLFSGRKGQLVHFWCSYEVLFWWVCTHLEVHTFIELVTYIHKWDPTFRLFWCCFCECLWILGINIFLMYEHEWAVIWCLRWCLFWGLIGWGWWCWCFLDDLDDNDKAAEEEKNNFKPSSVAVSTSLFVFSHWPTLVNCLQQCRASNWWCCFLVLSIPWWWC